ncbi:MAG: serine hydrolase [Bacteroidota bacterium]
MKIFVSTAAFFIFSLSIAKEEDHLNSFWIDGSTSNNHIEKGQTIYFSEWNETTQHFLKDKNYSVAIKMDHRFDPLPFDDLDFPSITSLGAISSDSLLNNYLTFLEQFGRTKGVNYLVLPDSSGLSSLEKRVIHLAHQKSPFFFLKRSILSHNIPDSKKEYLDRLSDRPKIWVVAENENTKKIIRWNAKYKEDSYENFFNKIESAKKKAFIPTYDIPPGLKKTIFESATFAIDNDFLLPLKSPRLTYLGDDLNLKMWLEKYVEVFDTRIKGIPAIVDLRDISGIKSKNGDIILTRRVVENFYNVAQIVLPLRTNDEAMLLAQMLFGARSIVGNHLDGRILRNQQFLGYSNLQFSGIEKNFLHLMDSLSEHAIRNYATPGLQLVVVKNGNIVYQASRGHYTYDSIMAVNEHTLYDLASLTKVMATLPAVALLVDRNLIDLDDSISSYLPEFVRSNKSHVTIRQLLSHNGGLKPYVPFWSMILGGDRINAFYYKTKEDEAKDIRTYGYQPDPIMVDTLRSFIVQSNLIKNPSRYKYSDLGFMILHLIVEQVTKKPFDEFLAEEFYHPMGLSKTTFNPHANGFLPEQIAPTEYDKRFRNYQVWGEVHDRNATIFGGVAGHAGLFSNATDLAKMMHMFLNKGYYGGRRYLSQDVLRKFNKRYFKDNRRGLGWDKKDGIRDAGSTYASDESFGHTGFTGTMVWADPQEELIFIFLSNSIYPNANNNRLRRYNVRTRMHDSIYESIKRNMSVKLN